MSTYKDLLRIVGTENTNTNRNACTAYSHDGSFIFGEEASCVVTPRTAEQVLEIVKLANSEKFPLVPVSSTGPRFRGDTVPKQKGAVVVDLSLMKSIVRIDRRSKTALVEPGVTFGELIDAAAAKGLRVAAPLLPKKTKSVVASMLEREPTTLPKYHWDMQDPLCCVEVIFGSGDLFRTGAAAGPGSIEQQWASGQAQKSPMGPAQTDWAKIIQASQGTMGIVTWASVKLELKPQVEKAFIVGASRLDDLVDFAYALTRTRYADHCFILNNVDCAAITGGKPDKAMPAWVLFYTISGYERFPEDRVRYLEKDIDDIAAKLKVRPSQEVGSLKADALLKLMGKPSDDPYWKMKKSHGFQDIMFLNTLDHSSNFINEIQQLSKSFGIAGDAIGIYLQPLQQGRICHNEYTVMYDPGNPEEAKKTQAFCESATRKILDMGGFFSRPYAESAQAVYEKCPDAVAALHKVKKILDPRGVMNPGRLCFN
ncbi:MAG: FAD-binding oxidoreductase [Spirochaetes bacterium]|nr:FAD-binding oxidoreductase [Spirochaetota bacterium]